MPVHQCHTVKRGTSGRSVFLFAHTERGFAATSLPLDQTQAAYVRTGEAAVEISVTPGAIGSFAPGSITEVDASLLPGVYQFDVPDDALSSGANEAILMIQIPGATVEPIRFNLVAYDPQDAWSLGMTQLQDYKRHQVLRQALPRFTEMELALGEQNEQRLADRLGETPPAWAEEHQA